MSNRRGVSALTRDLLLQMIRFQGGLAVNVEGGIGSKNPHLVHLIEDGLVKLTRRGNRTEMSTAKHVGRIIRRTYAISVDPVQIDKVVCPGCGELCSTPDVTYRFIREKHKFDCEVRQDHWADSYSRRHEARNAALGRPTRVGDRTYHDTRASKRRDKKRAKRLAAKMAKFPPVRKVQLTVTYEQSLT